MAEQSIGFDAASQRWIEKAFHDKGIEKAVIRALVKAGRDGLRTMKTDSKRRVRERKRMKSGRVDRSLPLSFPKGSKSLESLVWRMNVSGAPVPVSEYPFRQVRAGVSVGINKGKRSLIKSAFAATMKSGHVGVFRRVGKARLPIKELFTTRVSDVFNDSGMIPAVFVKTTTELTKTFERVLPMELEKIR